MKIMSPLLTVLLLAPLATLQAAERITEVCVYAGTASGLLSAITVAKSGRQVLVIEPSRWLGGMTGGGIRVGRDCVYPNDIGGLTKLMLKEDFCYSWGYTEAHSGLDSFPEFQRPLGPPAADAVWNGLSATREFAHASVWIDLPTKQARIDWK